MINSHAHLDFDDMNAIAENAVAIVPSIGKQNWTTEDVIFLLKKHPKVKGEIHGFSGSESQAHLLTRMGFYLGFGMQITNKKSTKIRQIVKNCPLEFILIETDDHPNPDDLTLVAQEIAELKQISIEEVVQQCDNNAVNLFNLK